MISALFNCFFILNSQNVFFMFSQNVALLILLSAYRIINIEAY